MTLKTKKCRYILFSVILFLLALLVSALTFDKWWDRYSSTGEIERFIFYSTDGFGGKVLPVISNSKKGTVEYEMMFNLMNGASRPFMPVYHETPFLIVDVIFKDGDVNTVSVNNSFFVMNHGGAYMLSTRKLNTLLDTLKVERFGLDEHNEEKSGITNSD